MCTKITNALTLATDFTQFTRFCAVTLIIVRHYFRIYTKTQFVNITCAHCPAWLIIARTYMMREHRCKERDHTLLYLLMLVKLLCTAAPLEQNLHRLSSINNCHTTPSLLTTQTSIDSRLVQVSRQGHLPEAGGWHRLTILCRGASDG
jgi:hypothetical protein